MRDIETLLSRLRASDLAPIALALQVNFAAAIPPPAVVSIMCSEKAEGEHSD